jgi:hypothetical protein
MLPPSAETKLCYEFTKLHDQFDSRQATGNDLTSLNDQSLSNNLVCDKPATLQQLGSENTQSAIVMALL